MTELTPDERLTLSRLRDAIASLPGLKLDLLVNLLTIASEPGLSINELAEKTATPQASASRYVSVLTGRYQSDILEPAVPLVVQEIRVDDPRSRALFLTALGHQAIRVIINAWDPSADNGGGKK